MKETIEVWKPAGKMLFLGKEITFYGTPEKPLFLAKDVAELTGYSKNNVRKFFTPIDELERRSLYVEESCGDQILVRTGLLTEKGLYQAAGLRRNNVTDEFYGALCEMARNPNKKLLELVEVN